MNRNGMYKRDKYTMWSTPPVRVGHVWYLSRLVHTTYYFGSKKHVFSTKWPFRYISHSVHGHVQFETSGFRYQDHSGNNAISVPLLTVVQRGSPYKRF